MSATRRKHLSARPFGQVLFTPNPEDKSLLFKEVQGLGVQNVYILYCIETFGYIMSGSNAGLRLL